jgi:hypothetical protein
MNDVSDRISAVVELTTEELQKLQENDEMQPNTIYVPEDHFESVELDNYLDGTQSITFKLKAIDAANVTKLVEDLTSLSTFYPDLIVKIDLENPSVIPSNLLGTIVKPVQE